MDLKLHVIAVILFYVILTYVTYTSLKHLMNEPTAFEESHQENQTVLPSFTMCPLQLPNTNYSSIQSFEEIQKAIEESKNTFSFSYFKEKSYEN